MATPPFSTVRSVIPQALASFLTAVEYLFLALFAVCGATALVISVLMALYVLFVSVAFLVKAVLLGGRRCVAAARWRWTVPPRRVMWRSLRSEVDASTPLLSNSNTQHSSETLATNTLCEPCYTVVHKSKLLSGSFLPFVRRQEWHAWVLPLHAGRLRSEACHLCRALWSASSLGVSGDAMTTRALRDGDSAAAKLEIRERVSTRWLGARQCFVRIHVSGPDAEFEPLSDYVAVYEGKSIRGWKISGLTVCSEIGRPGGESAGFNVHGRRALHCYHAGMDTDMQRRAAPIVPVCARHTAKSAEAT